MRAFDRSMGLGGLRREWPDLRLSFGHGPAGARMPRRFVQREVKRRLDSPTQDVAQTKELHGVSDYEQDRVEYFLLYTIS